MTTLQRFAFWFMFGVVLRIWLEIQGMLPEAWNTLRVTCQ